MGQLDRRCAFNHLFDVNINTNKFTIAGTTGNTAIAGDLNINGGEFTVDHATGNTVAAGTIGASNFSGSSSGTNTGDQTSFAWKRRHRHSEHVERLWHHRRLHERTADGRYAQIAGPFPWADVSWSTDHAQWLQGC